MRREPLFPNATIVARREYTELVRSRLFLVSTGFLVLLAVVVAMMPLVIKLAERGSVTRVDVAASDPELALTSVRIIDGILNSGIAGTAQAPYQVRIATDEADGGPRRGGRQPRCGGRRGAPAFGRDRIPAGERRVAVDGAGDAAPGRDVRHRGP